MLQARSGIESFGKEVGIILAQYILMRFMLRFDLSLSDRDEGQGLAEYALILALIAIVAIVALIFLGGKVSGILRTVGTSI